MVVPRLRSFLAVLALGALARPAAAEPTAADRAAADELYKQGRQLASEGRFVEACPKFAGSQRLDPGVGTLLYLGECYEKTARLASAWNAFREAADLARATQQAPREKVALERASALDKRMPRLVIELEAGAKLDGLVVQRDGAPVLPDLFGAALPLDSGSHTVSATAPGRAPWSATVELRDGATDRVKVPALAPAAAPPPPTSAVAPAPLAPAASSAAPAPPPPPPPGDGSSRRTWALVAGGVGVVGLGVGTAFGLSAISSWNKVKDDCPTRPRCTGSDRDTADQASRSATLSTVSFTVGLLGLGAGAALWFWPSSDARATALRVAPGSVSLEGTW